MRGTDDDIAGAIMVLAFAVVCAALILTGNPGWAVVIAVLVLFT